MNNIKLESKLMKSKYISKEKSKSFGDKIIDNLGYIVIISFVVFIISSVVLAYNLSNLVK